MTPLLQDVNRTVAIFPERYTGKLGGKMRGKLGGKLLFLAVILLSGGVALMLMSMPVAAQSTTVTPHPGPAQTATAAAQRMTQAQQKQAQGAQMKADADAARARAAQLEAQGNDAINNGIASYAAAASDAEQAAAALQAQQVGVASELLARSQANIETGKGQLSTAQNAISELSSMADAQAGTIISLTTRLQQAEMNVLTLRNAYTATVAQQDAEQKQGLAGNAIVLLVFIAACLALVALLAQIIRNRRGTTYSVDGVEVIDAEDETL